MELIILTAIAITFILGLYLAVRVITPVVSDNGSYNNYQATRKTNHELQSFQSRIIKKTVELRTGRR